MDRKQDRLNEGDVLANLRRMIAQRLKEPNRLRVKVLELALALIESAAQDGALVQGTGEAAAPMAEWADDCAALVAAIAQPLAASAEDSRLGLGSPHADSLAAAASRLAATTRRTHEGMKTAASGLKAECAELLRRAGDVGSFRRTLQQEESRLAGELRTLALLEEQIARVSAERGSIVERTGLLQERLRIALATPEQLRKLNEQVVECEAVARQKQAEMKAIQARLEALQEELAGLPANLERTKKLVADLESSPERELIRGIREIWSRLPLDPSGMNR